MTPIFLELLNNPNNNANPFPGVVVSILLLAFVLAFPLSMLLIQKYKDAIIRGMGYSSKKFTETEISYPTNQNKVPDFNLEVVDLTTLKDDNSKVYAKLKETLGYHWFTYGFMCLAFGMFNTYCYLSSFDSMSFWRFINGLLIFSASYFPVTFLLLVGGLKDTIKFAILLLFFYLSGTFLVKEYAGSAQKTFFQSLLPILIYNAIPIVLILILRTKRIKSVGILLYAFFIIVVSGPLLLYFGLSSNPAFLRSVAGSLINLDFKAYQVHIILLLISLAIALGIGWLLIKKIRSWYLNKQLNDIQLNADAIVLLFNINYAVFILLNDVGFAFLSLLAFPIYKLVGYACFSLLRKRKIRSQAPRLLLLRVFALGDDSRNLFERIMRYWRYAGSIQMISGPDLATTTIEPHELIAYVSGQLNNAFCEDEDSIKTNIAKADLLPDLDSTHRVNEFFCRDNNWKQVLKGLVNSSDLVLMDLRRFSNAFNGCKYEIKALVNWFPMAKTIFIVDEFTDIEFTKATFIEGFEAADPNSVNLKSTTKITLFKTGKSQGDDVFKILDILCSKIDENPTQP